MKTPTIVLIVAILIAGGIGFFIGRGNTPNDNSSATIADKSEETKKTPEENAAPADSTAATTLVEDGTGSEPTPSPTDPAPAAEGTAGTATPTPAPAPTAVPTPAPTPVSTSTPTPAPTPSTSGTVLKPVDIGRSAFEISVILESISKNIEAKTLEYDAKKKQDCSGIFHQLKDSLQARIPKLANQGKFKFPAFETDRSSRQIADWYYRNGNLLLVEDPIASRNSIRPGSVMFFSKPGKKYSNIDIDLLTNRQNGYTNKGAIMHIAVVTTVMTDENGNVEEYTMMHGRNKKVHASRSGSGIKQSDNTPDLPPFGNWAQQWVAVANIVTPK